MYAMSSTVTVAILVFAWLDATTATTTTSTLPQIDFNALGQVGVVGSFAGLSFFDAALNATTVAYRMNSSSLISRSADGTLVNLGATNELGTISTICQSTNGIVYIGGSFVEIGGSAASNIARYDPTSKVFTALGGGLDGPVATIACNTSTLYIGGSFGRPLGSAATAGYGGNVAAWSTLSSTWSALPFSGFNGPIRSISSSSDGQTLLFGGSFSTQYSNSSRSSNSNSTSIHPSLGSSLSPISLSKSDTVANPSSSISGFGTPSTIFCPSGADGPSTSWLLQDGATGSFITRLYRPLNVRGIRLGNTFYGGRGTSNFTFISIPYDTIPTLTYLTNPADPNSALATCSRNCPLSHDPTVPYQDFLLPANTTMTGFEIDIFGFYGVGAGLHLLQLLSDGAFAYAIDADNLSTCGSGLGATKSSNVSTTGTWSMSEAFTDIPGTLQEVLVSSPIPGGSAMASPPTLTWSPYVVQNGVYDVYLSAPGCTCLDDCANRTIVDYTIRANNNATPTVVRLDQRMDDDLTLLIYTLPLLASSSTNGGMSVTLSLAAGGAPTAGVDYQLIAESISLVARSTNGTPINIIENGIGLFEYDISLPTTANLSSNNVTLNISSATAIDLLSTKLSVNSTISDVIAVGPIVFVAGRFKYTNGTTAALNILAYSSANGLVTSPNGGLDGNVTSIVELNGYIYAAGTFSSTSDGKVARLEGAARWEYGAATSVWQSLGLLPFSPGSITSLGVFNNGSTELLFALGQGLHTFDPSSMTWNGGAIGMVVGNLTAFGSANSRSSSLNQVTYLAGDIVSVSSTAAPGGALLSSAKDGSAQLSSFGFQLQLPSMRSVSSPSLADILAVSNPDAVKKTIFSTNSLRSMVGGMVSLVAPPTLDARNLLRSKFPPSVTILPSATSLSVTSQILAGAFWTRGALSIMLIGGNFVSTSGVRNIGLYDTVSQNLTALVGESITGTVTTLFVSGNVAWIGGNFSTSTGREGLTTYDLASMKIDESQPALEGFVGTNATVNVIAQRPGFDNTMIVAGVFATAGALPCASICQWDSKTVRWTSLGTGLDGVVGSLAFAGPNSQYLIAAGSFVLNGTTAYIAQYDFVALSWSLIGSPTSIPGPATALSSDNGVDSKLFLAGMASGTNSTYLVFWNGTVWSDINDGILSTGSDVQQLAFVPLASGSSIRGPDSSIIESDRMLLVSGELTINQTSISSALFDGVRWYPYLIASTAAGGTGIISRLFYSVMNFNLSAARHLAVGIVILISMAIALGVVFFLVLIGVLFALARRNEESQSGKPIGDDSDSTREKPRRPTSLLAAVGAATAVLLDEASSEKERHRPSIRQPGNAIGSTVPAADQREDDDDDDAFGQESGDFDSAARVRYSFAGEHPGELSVSSGEDLTILEASDPNWWLVSNASGAKGLIPASYLV